MSDQVTYSVDVFDTPAVFTYEGGEYIDVEVGGVAVDCLNNWDHAEDRPRVSIYSEPQLARLADAWIAELSSDDWAEALSSARVSA